MRKKGEIIIPGLDSCKMTLRISKLIFWMHYIYMCVCVGAVDFPPNTILKLYNVFFANVLLTIELGNGR